MVGILNRQHAVSAATGIRVFEGNHVAELDRALDPRPASEYLAERPFDRERIRR